MGLLSVGGIEERASVTEIALSQVRIGRLGRGEVQGRRVTESGQLLHV